ncbi:MFS transporter (macronuclear) [Tetrahymena thermophila SB210]|uniref:MFS transporter n=1 Tax=Tetrahymena thermophila (strain SB210) TaxID=312017 RepID=W7XES7_TETTS|nr:MFS transporter [Tetrahymena thermophila SB210]EWS72426.1 MFS transporter [Tetrahymena thermophila SB210]|eukprot:XP_012655053.1 MFS transporter [Tetrahymena thermophila SB210]
MNEQSITAQQSLSKSNSDNQVNIEQQKDFKEYSYRWSIVIMFCLVNMMNSIQSITFSPISSQVEQAYNTSKFIVSMTSLVTMLCYIIFNFPSNYILSHKGLKIGIFVGIFFTILGSWIRLFINNNFGWAILGQVFAGIAQPFILNAPTQIAAVWFKPYQRQLATSILCLVSVIGVGIGFLFSSFIVNPSYTDDTKQEIYNLMLFQAITITACCIPSLFFFKEKPPTPPSLSASFQKTEFWISLSTLFRNKHFLFTCIYFGCILGNFNSVSALINFYLKNFNFSTNETSYLGGAFILSGIIGSAIITRMVEKNNKYKKYIIISSILSLFSYTFVSAVLIIESFIVQLLGFFLYGFFSTPLIPLTLEFGCEITFPISESTSSGLIYMSGQLFGILQIILSAEAIQIESQKNVLICLSLGFFLQLFGLVFIVQVEENLKRKNQEQLQLQKQTEQIQELSEVIESQLKNQSFMSFLKQKNPFIIHSNSKS